MQVDTAGGGTMPTDRAVVVPPRTRHQAVMRGVSTRSLYLEPAAVRWFPGRCRIVEVSPWLRELLLAAVDIPAHYAPRARDGVVMELILHEIQALTPCPSTCHSPATRACARCA